MSVFSIMWILTRYVQSLGAIHMHVLLCKHMHPSHTMRSWPPGPRGDWVGWGWCSRCCRGGISNPWVGFNIFYSLDCMYLLSAAGDPQNWEIAHHTTQPCAWAVHLQGRLACVTQSCPVHSHPLTRSTHGAASILEQSWGCWGVQAGVLRPQSP